MINELKIITMTRLALYDKHEGPADRAANDYFRHDFIYRNNLGTRLAVGFGGVIVLAVYWIQALLVNEVDIFELNIQEHVTDSVFFLLAVLAVYSLIGSIQGTRQYYLVQKRLAQYQALVRQLERLEERAKRSLEEETQLLPKDAPPMYNPSPPVRTAPVEHTRPVGNYEHTRHPGPRPGQPPPGYRPRPRPQYTNPNHANPPERPIDHTRVSERTERVRPIEQTRAPKRRTYPIDQTRAPERSNPIDQTRAPERYTPIEHTIAPEGPAPIDVRPPDPPHQ